MVPEWARGIGLKEGGPLGRLLAVDRWCCWRWSQRSAGVWVKRPVVAVPVGTGYGLGTNKPELGRSYAVAEGMVQRAAAGGVDMGVGWLVTGDLGLVWLDLDKCRDPKTEAIDAWAQDLLARCPGAYWEVTPSGAGLRIVGLAPEGAEELQATWKVRADGARPGAQVEIYLGCVRYVTVTGAGKGELLEGDVAALGLELAALAEAQAPKGKARAKGDRIGWDEQAPIEDVAAALAAIPNGDGWDEGRDWKYWNTIGMACWIATGASEEGLRAWEAWSARCEDKHGLTDSCEARWEHFWTSPPNNIGVGKLVIEAGRATGGAFRRPSHAPERDFTREEGDGSEEGEDAAGGVGRADRAHRAGGGGGSGGVGPDADLTPFMRLATRLIHVMDVDRFYDPVADLNMDVRQVCVMAAGMGVEDITTGVSGKSLWRQLIQHPSGALRQAQGFTVRPGRGVLVEEERGLCVNLWRPSRLVPSEADADVWLEHVERLIPDAADCARVLDRMAFALQCPGVKINSALVLLGKQGTGKDTLLRPFWAAVGEHNHAVVPGLQVGGDFNEYMRKPWLLISEMPSFRKRSSYEEIKAVLTTPPDTLRINIKNVSAFFVPNITNVIVTTNHEDAIALADDDRRFDVVETALAGDTAYFDRLYAWMDAGGDEAVAGYLLKRDCAAFNPKKAPPMSKAKAAMTREAEPAAMAWARGLWAEGGPLEDRKLVTMDELVDMAGKGVWGAGDMARGHKLMEQIKRALAADGWASTGIQIRDRGARPRPWARSTVELYSQMDGTMLHTKLEDDRKASNARDFGND